MRFQICDLPLFVKQKNNKNRIPIERLCRQKNSHSIVFLFILLNNQKIAKIVFIAIPKYIIKYCSFDKQGGQSILSKQGSHSG